VILAEILKIQFYTCRTWSLTQKWDAKTIGNKNDNTLKKMSDNSLKTRSEWQHTQEKDEHYSSRNILQEDHEGSSWENREKLDWA
jgi:hypothetical protein